MTAPVKGEYRVPPSPTPENTTSHHKDTGGADGGGLSNTHFAKLCGTGKRQLRAIRDNPEELASFSRERTGQAYEYRDGHFYPIEEPGA